ncbi:MAG TPA: DUF4173 domain-containing protein [Gemmatimonadaceae bacterium]|nr:DUF4173 domain-containing protein [Gemmatimonadaceae bacterium]
MTSHILTSLMGARTGAPPAAARDQQPLSLPRDARVVWIGAAVVGAMGAAIVFDAPPGINWGIWTGAAIVAFLLARRATHREVPATVALCAALAMTLAASAAITANPPLQAVIMLGTAGLLALAVMLCAGVDVRDVGPMRIVFAPLLAWLMAAAEVIRRGQELLEHARGRRFAATVRGLVVAAPVVVVFALLLSEADPTFALWRDDAFRTLGTMAFLPRLIFFAALAALSLGANGVAARGGVPWRTARTQSDAGAPSPEPWTSPSPSSDARATAIWTLGSTERLLVTGSVCALFAVFLLLQLSYLFGNAPAVQGSGVTFAEYARRGFGELSVVTTLCVLLLTWVFHGVRPARQAPALRWAGLAIVVELQLLTDSAMHRVWLYQQAYGFTAARVLALAYMVAITVMLAALGIELWNGLDARRLARWGLVTAAAAVTAMSVWNFEAFVVRWNVQRYVETGKVDWDYLANDLSANAVPELMRQRAQMPADRAAWLTLRQRAELRAEHGTYVRGSHVWYAWNLGRSRAAAALAADSRSDDQLRALAGDLISPPPAPATAAPTAFSTATAAPTASPSAPPTAPQSQLQLEK